MSGDKWVSRLYVGWSHSGEPQACMSWSLDLSFKYHALMLSNSKQFSIYTVSHTRSPAHKKEKLTLWMVSARWCFMTKQASKGNWFVYCWSVSPTAFFNSESTCMLTQMMSASFGSVAAGIQNRCERIAFEAHKCRNNGRYPTITLIVMAIGSKLMWMLFFSN